MISIASAVLSPFRWWLNTIKTFGARDNGSVLGPIENDDE
jgi:hypothetical protein